MKTGLNKEIKETLRARFNKRCCIYLLFLLCSIMILSLCFQDAINYDEYFSVSWCRLSWHGLWSQLMNDVHPPLYYIILKVIYDITCGNLFFCRLFSALSCIAMLWFGLRFCLTEFGCRSALFFIIFTYMNPFMIQKSSEIRMYMLASLFTVLSGIAAYHILNGPPLPRNWSKFTLFSLLAAYTHYYALLTMAFLYAGIFLYFIFTRSKKGFAHWSVCALCTVAGYLPWLPIAFRQVTSVNNAYWIEPPASRLGPIRQLFQYLSTGIEHIYISIFLLFLVLSLFLVFERPKTCILLGANVRQHRMAHAAFYHVLCRFISSHISKPLSDPGHVPVHTRHQRIRTPHKPVHCTCSLLLFSCHRYAPLHTGMECAARQNHFRNDIFYERKYRSRRLHHMYQRSGPLCREQLYHQLSAILYPGCGSDQS